MTQCWSNTRNGRPASCKGTTWSSRRRDPPARHQRLPTQGRGNPGLPVGAVASLRPGFVCRAHGTTPPGGAGFRWGQAAKGIRIERVRSRVLAPTPHLVRRIRETAQRVGADLVVLDPVFPLGLIGPRLGLPYAVLLHGAEVAIPSRLPASRQLVANVLRHSTLAVSAGGYPATEAAR